MPSMGRLARRRSHRMAPPAITNTSSVVLVRAAWMRLRSRCRPTLQKRRSSLWSDGARPSNHLTGVPCRALALATRGRGMLPAPHVTKRCVVATHARATYRRSRQSGYAPTKQPRGLPLRPMLLPNTGPRCPQCPLLFAHCVSSLALGASLATAASRAPGGRRLCSSRSAIGCFASQLRGTAAR